MAYALLYERTERYLLTITQACLLAGVEGPGVDDATGLLDEYLTREPESPEDAAVSDWRVAVGLREAV